MILGIGIDAVEVTRAQRSLERFDARIWERILSPEERRGAPTARGAARHLATRFAAKEAALKALGTGLARGIRWHDVEVGNDPAGAPKLRLSGAAEEHARRLGVLRTHVSITDTRGIAAAVVILEG